MVRFDYRFKKMVLDHADLLRAALYNHQINIQALDFSGNYELGLYEVLERIDFYIKEININSLIEHVALKLV